MAARKGRGNTAFTFNSVALTNYCNQADLEIVADRLETTHFGSSGGEGIPGDTTHSISVGGDWDVAVDTALAPTVGTGTKYTAVLVLTGSSSAVTYTWTSLAEIENYKVSSGASDKITWSASVVLNGAPSSRSVA